MMPQRHTFRYITVLAISLLALLPGDAYGQFMKKKKEKPEVVDTVPLFRGVAVSVDAVGLIQDATGDYGQYEGAVRVNLKDRYFPVIEVGYGKADKQNHNTGVHFKTSAPYGRIGCDFNIMKNKHDIYRVYAGGRYAFSSFKYDIEDITVKDPIWGEEAAYGGKDLKCTYQWVEALMGIDAKIWGPLRLGWSIRYRSCVSKKHGDMGKPWYVPGYGKLGETPLGGTFNITLEL